MWKGGRSVWVWVCGCACMPVLGCVYVCVNVRVNVRASEREGGGKRWQESTKLVWSHKQQCVWSKHSLLVSL